MSASDNIWRSIDPIGYREYHRKQAGKAASGPTITTAIIAVHEWGHSVVEVDLSDGTSKRLFQFYADEISFTEQEFIGLTVEQAGALRHNRDVMYLMS